VIRSIAGILVGILLVLLTISRGAWAEIPHVISYQGKVTDAGGEPVADSTYTMHFRIYDAETGGNLEWSSGNQLIPLASGVFSVMLGESPQPPLALDFDEDYWLHVTFGGQSQNPRQRLGSVGYAYMASGVVPGTTITGSGSWALKGENTAASGIKYGLYASCASNTGRAIFGTASSTTGENYGGRFESNSSSGTGVHGESPQYGVYGEATGPSALAIGVLGKTSSSEGTGVYGVVAATSGSSWGGRFVNSSTDGIGVAGWSIATSGAVSGVEGIAASANGTGVRGSAIATNGINYGGYFETESTSGRACYGWATATSGETYGGVFKADSPNGYGVWARSSATTGSSHAGHFESLSPEGRGVWAKTSATTGENYAGYFETASPEGRGVMGIAPATDGSAWGVYGRSSGTMGIGVNGAAWATIGETYGGSFYNKSTSGAGLRGSAISTTGSACGGSFSSDSPDGMGISADSPLMGVYGEATSTQDDDWGIGVKGESYSEFGRGVLGSALGYEGCGVFGEGGWCGGYFRRPEGDYWARVASSTHKIQGTGAVSFVQNHPERHDLVIMYTAPEGDEVATYTRGSASLKDGVARVPLGKTFKWVTNPDIGLTAHLTPRGKAALLFVEELTTEEMVVRSAEGFPGDVVFDYLVYGLRIGFEEIGVVKEKHEPAGLPSLEREFEMYARNPDLRSHNALERFKTMNSAIGADISDLSNASHLRDAIQH
jgi:hypothetical protein